MNLKSLLFLLSIVLMIIGCEDNISNQEKTDARYDANLIKAIQEATNKQDINAEDLPQASLTVLEQDYFDSYVEDAKMAPQLGYEVGLIKGNGAYRSDIGKKYFNLKGRELRGEKDSGKDGPGGIDRMECFTLVLPVTFIMPDGSEIIVENKEDWRKIKIWYETHPDSRERPDPQFPVEVTMKDGTTYTVNNDEEMRRLHEYCQEGRGNDDGDKDNKKCFELVYPATFVMPDRSTITIESRENMVSLRTWYADHPDTREKPALQFPVNLIFEDGTIITVNNIMEMRGVQARCDEGIGNHGGGRHGSGGNRP